MTMKKIAANVWQLWGFPPNAFNVYLVGDVLIDAATRWAKWRILRQLKGQKLSLVTLTHCHPDHQGVARLLCEKFNVPLACHEADVPVMEGRSPMVPQNRWIQRCTGLWAGPPYKVERVLRDGDMVAGFRVIHAPGHTPGQVIYFRESDRLAIAGDVLVNIHFLTGRAGLREPPPIFSVDAELNRKSVRMLWDLRPSVVCFGHGPPLRNMKTLERFMAQLQASGGNSPIP